MAQHKFNSNLIKLSQTNIFENAKLEWFYITTASLDKPDGICICQHTIKHVIYMFNIYTNHIIMVGTRCHKKFNMQIDKLTNSTLSKIVSNIVGEYKLIENLFDYSKDIQERLLKHYRDQIKKSNSTILLNLLRDEVKILIDDYNLLYLQYIYNEICCKYKECNEKEQCEQERRKKEQREREQKQRETKEKEKTEQTQFEKEQREREYLSAIKCICGIMKKNICICENPKYEQCKQTNKLFCKCCKNWKCRCMTSI